jgi:deoxyadenosine/deoxycytidine kinase
MGKLISVIGNSGTGKTSLVQALAKAGDFQIGFEEHRERPFQELFSKDLQRYALPNQVDYFLLRAEQESAIRQEVRTGLQDGGLEQDYFIFTHHFYNTGYLDRSEFSLLTRLYSLIRQLSPHPDLIIALIAPLEVTAERFKKRNRSLEIAQLNDLEALQSLLDNFLATYKQAPLIQVDAYHDDPTYSGQIDSLLESISNLLG